MAACETRCTAGPDRQIALLYRGFGGFLPCQIATPRHATDPPHPRLIHLVQQESAPGRQKRASWLLCSLTGMTLKAPKSPPQPVRLTDSEDVFCKAVGLDSNDHNDRLLLSEVKVGTQIERCFYVSHTG